MSSRGQFIHSNGFVALLGRKNLGSLPARALRTISHRAWEGFLFSTSDEEISDNLEEASSITSKSCVGCCLLRSERNFSPFTLHGDVYQDGRSEIMAELSDSLADNGEEGLARKLGSLDADYALAFLVGDDELLVARDPLGVKPLFIGRNSDLIGVGSEPRSLREIGLTAVDRIIPGHLYKVTRAKTEIITIRIPEPRKIRVGLAEASQKVLSYLKESVRRRVSGLKRVAVAFSGGLDSSLLAVLASEITEVRLISIITPGSKDESRTVQAAKMLEMEHEPVVVNYEEVSETIPKLRQLLGTDDLMNLSIGLGMHLTAKETRKEGLENVLVGQMADELFGGYSKYLRGLSRGRDHVEKMLLNDVLHGYENNFERDERAMASYANPLMPYASIGLVEYGISLPVELKIDLERGVRKKVLQEAAAKAGLPSGIFLEPKSALQYSTGLQKMVTRSLKDSHRKDL